MSPVHKDKHMIGTCPDCPDGLQEEDMTQGRPLTLREALRGLMDITHDLCAADGGVDFTVEAANSQARAALAVHDAAHRDGAEDACPCFAEAWRRAWAVIEARHASQG